MNANLQALFDPTDPEARRRGLAGVLAQPDAPAQLERALLDLLDLGDPVLLEELARGLSAQATEPAARRVLESISRANGGGGPARAAALRALRGDVQPASNRPPPAQPTAPSNPALAALERAATTPTPEALDDAELALIEVDPDVVDTASCEALADRLTAVARAHADPESSARLERLARELRETSS